MFDTLYHTPGITFEHDLILNGSNNHVAPRASLEIPETVQLNPELMLT